MNTIISILLLFTYNSLQKDIYYYLAKYILDHFNEMENISIGKLANDCGTSIATIRKFWSFFGVDNYKEFKTLLTGTKTGRMNQIKSRYKYFNEKDIFLQIKYLSKTEIDEEEMNHQLDEVVDLIHKSQHIYLFGAAYPLAIGLNFAEDMLIFEKPVYFEHIGFNSHIQQFQNDDMIIFITITGRMLSHNRQVFLDMYNTPANKVVISQNSIFDTFSKLDNFVRLEGVHDDENENLIIVEILNLIKYKYYKKYINFFD